MDLAKVGGGRTAHWRARPAALNAVVPARAGLSRQGLGGSPWESYWRLDLMQ
jgi:hypothetical protein